MSVSKRLFDIVTTLVGAIVLSPLLLLSALLVRLTSRGPVLYWSERVGRYNHIFLMPKFRSMRIDTPQVASHLLVDPSCYLTPVGGFLRKTSLDELPQLWSILVGDMSIVGPRPALFNQYDLIELRTREQVHELVPGLTGLAQIAGRDDLPLAAKVSMDSEYRLKQTFWFDLRIIALTFKQVIYGTGISH